MRRPGKQRTFLKYGAEWHSNADPLEIEFEMIRRFGRFEFRGRRCGEGLPFHVKQAMKLLWPEMDWHRWVDVLVEEFLRSPGRCGVFGPSSSGKSYILSRSALVMFYARPKGTTVLISSTTLDALHRRIWDYLVRSDKDARQIYPNLPGSLIESKTMMLADPKTEENRSFKDGIVGVAAKKGGQWQGLAEYIGCKNDVIIVLADELQFVPVGVVDALANLESNQNCYFAGMGNLPDIFNALGIVCEPKLGWDSLPDTEKTRVYSTKWHNGRAVQLIGLDSPNLDFPDGQEPYKGLIGRRYIEQCAINYGRDSDKFNMFASGKIPRASMNRCVFTKAMCLKYNAMEGVTWGHEPLHRGYALDAAYSGIGGDRTCGAPFIWGKDSTDKLRFWLGPLRIFPGSETPKLSHAEAIALQVKEECEAHSIEPAHVYFDGTGRSELTSAFARLWSSAVVPIEFGGPATERPSFTGERWLEGEQAGDAKLCRDVFDRFVTELWFAIRHCILADQMRGLTEHFIQENSQRRWELVRGAKYSVEPKQGMKDNEPVGMKARGLISPDTGDCAAVALEGARRQGFPLGKHATPQKKRDNSFWLKAMADRQWQKAKQEVLTA
jgi:hypothetical protein